MKRQGKECTFLNLLRNNQDAPKRDSFLLKRARRIGFSFVPLVLSWDKQGQRFGKKLKGFAKYLNENSKHLKLKITMKKYLGIRQARRDARQKKDHPMPYFEIIFWQGNASFLKQRGLPLILLKLTAALGITWVLGFALAFYPSPYLEYPFVIINSCQGKSFLSVLHFPTPLFCNKSFGLAKRHAKCVVVYFCKRLAIDRTIVTFCQLCKTTENLLTIFKIERHSNNGKRKSYPYNCSRLVRLVAVEHTQRTYLSPKQTVI